MRLQAVTIATLSGVAWRTSVAQKAMDDQHLPLMTTKSWLAKSISLQLMLRTRSTRMERGIPRTLTRIWELISQVQAQISDQEALEAIVRAAQTKASQGQLKIMLEYQRWMWQRIGLNQWRSIFRTWSQVTTITRSIPHRRQMADQTQWSSSLCQRQQLIPKQLSALQPEAMKSKDRPPSRLKDRHSRLNQPSKTQAIIAKRRVSLHRIFKNKIQCQMVTHTLVILETQIWLTRASFKTIVNFLRHKRSKI